MHEMTQNCYSTLMNWSKIGFWTILAGQKNDILTTIWPKNHKFAIPKASDMLKWAN